MASSIKTTATLATGMKAPPCALCSRTAYTTKFSVTRRANLSLAPRLQVEEPCRRAGVCDAQKAPEGIARTVDTMLKRYDFVSTGVGALCVTGYFHYVHGQAPLEALSITAVSTIAALVVNELFFNDKH